MITLRKKIFLFLSALFFLLFQDIAFADDDFIKLATMIYKKDLKGVEELITSGVDVNIRQESSGSTPLIVACSIEGTEEIIEFLILKGADVNAIAADGRTPLIWAASNSKKAVELLLAEGADPGAKGADGMTAFIQSILGIISGSVNTEVCDLLLDKGANVNDNITGADAAGWTALMFAANNEKPGLVKYLISKGANVNHQAGDGKTSLMMASKWGYKETVIILVENGANVNLKAIDGSTALSLAIKENSEEIIKILKARKN